MPPFHDRIKQKESFLTNVDFSKEDVKKILHSLGISKSPGPDNFHPRILKELSNELSEPLFLLFSKSLTDGVLPKIWKDAHVLLNRRQRVVLNNSKSNWTEVISSVPQGSVLGPILFILYINDLPDAIRCVSKLFADDTKLYRTVDSYGDSNMLQMDLYELDNWSESWQMKFNIQKCKVLHLAKKPKEFLSDV